MAEDFSKPFIGKHLLVGMTYLDQQGDVTHQVQFHGMITEVSVRGITIRRHDTGEYFTLPPATDSLKPAPKGEYRLRTTGEVVVDPDYLTTWTVNPPNADDSGNQAEN